VLRGLVVVATCAAVWVSPSVAAVPYKGPPTPCDRGLSANDVAGILKGKATANHYTMVGNPGEGCELGVVGEGNAIAMVDITVRKGDLSFQLMVTKNRTAEPGFGDQAFFTPTTSSNIPNADETDFYVRKGGRICIAQLHRTVKTGQKLVIPASDHDVAMKLGALCDRAFAIK
jgi:hypothetical protein